MPGSVANAAPTTVMPESLCRMFRASREWMSHANFYRGGESQVAYRVATSRKAFEIGKRLTATELATLRTFFTDTGHDCFFFYYPWETDPLFSYDEAGTEATGRYTVRFDGEWSQQNGMGRGDVSIRLVEVN